MVEKIQIPPDGTHMDIILSSDDEIKEANFFLENTWYFIKRIYLFKYWGV